MLRIRMMALNDFCSSQLFPRSPASACTKEYIPVICGELDCEYDNACLAGSAGFANCTEACPKPDGRPCTLEYMPLICGMGCEYSNKWYVETTNIRYYSKLE